MNPEVIRQQFPVYTAHPSLVYLDTASSALVPTPVIDAMNQYYKEYPTNVHRGLYPLAMKAENAYESAREIAANFIGAKQQEIIFTSGTTDAINRVVRMVEATIQKGDHIVLTRLEHHANLIPWQQLAERTGAELRFIELLENGEIDLESARSVITADTAVVACTAMSNVFGTRVPVKELCILAKKHQAISVIDAAQAIAHDSIDVTDLGCDFLVFSGHKLYGPTGVGVLYGKEKMLNTFEPIIFGGDMIRHVSFTQAQWADLPNKHEPGTPSIASVIGLGAAITFFSTVYTSDRKKHEEMLGAYAREQLQKIPGCRVHSPEDSVVVSITIDGVHPHDAADILGQKNICVRAGNHCAEPLMTYKGLDTGTLRLSFGVYNTREDIDQCCSELFQIQKMFC